MDPESREKSIGEPHRKVTHRVVVERMDASKFLEQNGEKIDDPWAEQRVLIDEAGRIAREGKLSLKPKRIRKKPQT